MTNVAVSNYYPKSFYDKEAGQYLIANGFSHSRMFGRTSNTHYFHKGDIGVVFYGDSADFVIKSANGLKRKMSLTCISSLNLFDWMLMFHVAKVVPLKSFIRSSANAGKDVHGAMTQLFEHFRVMDNHESVTVDY